MKMNLSQTEDKSKILIFKNITRGFLILLFLITLRPCYAADDKQFEPWDNYTNDTPAVHEKDVVFPGSLLIKSVRFYQNYISPVRGIPCPMYPSCSEYSIEAIKKHGFFMGIMMTVDRLIHEVDEFNYAPVVNIEGRRRFYDTVENNDFWWSDRKEINYKYQPLTKQK